MSGECLLGARHLLGERAAKHMQHEIHAVDLFPLLSSSGSPRSPALTQTDIDHPALTVLSQLYPCTKMRKGLDSQGRFGKSEGNFYFLVSAPLENTYNL